MPFHQFHWWKTSLFFKNHSLPVIWASRGLLMPVKIHIPTICTIPSGTMSCLVICDDCLSHALSPRTQELCPMTYQNHLYFKVYNGSLLNSFVLSSTFFSYCKPISQFLGFECKGKENWIPAFSRLLQDLWKVLVKSPTNFATSLCFNKLEQFLS